MANIIAGLQEWNQRRRIQEKTDQLLTLQCPSSPRKHKVKLEEKDQECSTHVPVTILTGFLGSGKTTLLNYILTSDAMDTKLMVIENEIGKTSIDHTLLSTTRQYSTFDPEKDIYIMENGCMCCSLTKNAGNELERILDHLLKVGKTNGYDYVLIETSGLADPGPIIRTFLQLRSSCFVLDGVVTMVSVTEYLQQISKSNPMTIEMHRQLIYADVIVLNKTDLATTEQIQQAITQLKQNYPDAKLLQSCKDDPVEVTQLLDLRTFDEEKFSNTTKLFNSTKPLHTANVDTFHFKVDATIDLSKFVHWLKQVVNQSVGKSIFRLKGILAIEEEERPVVVQCVLDTYTIAPHAIERWKTNRYCTLVIIGQDLDRNHLWNGFINCFAAEITLAEKKQV